MDSHRVTPTQYSSVRLDFLVSEVRHKLVTLGHHLGTFDLIETSEILDFHKVVLCLVQMGFVVVFYGSNVDLRMAIISLVYCLVRLDVILDSHSVAQVYGVPGRVVWMQCAIQKI